MRAAMPVADDRSKLTSAGQVSNFRLSADLLWMFSVKSVQSPPRVGSAAAPCCGIRAACKRLWVLSRILPVALLWVCSVRHSLVPQRVLKPAQQVLHNLTLGFLSCKRKQPHSCEYFR